MTKHCFDKAVIMILLCFITFFFLCSCGTTEDVVRSTIYGKIRGEIRASRAVGSNAKYYYFTGIPYARPPIGSLRFQEPEPPESWDDIRDATTPGSMCAQIENLFMGPNVVGSEDCLYLEISVPILSDVDNATKLPVMVWIHGGTFLFAGINETGPDYLMEEPVILVSMEYRLNVFGFLSTQDKYASGNVGLKDQLFVLKWVRNNIENFGGDPNKVTIFGCSAGGASVLLHMVSSQSKGLFHRAISQSGVPLNRWALQRKPMEKARKLGEAFGINLVTNQQLVKQLQKVPFRDLLKAAFDSNVVGNFLPYTEQPFGPSIEEYSSTAFITERVYAQLEKGNVSSVPYIMGYNTEEGSFPYTYIDRNNVDINIYEENPQFIIPLSMNIPQDSPCNNFSESQIKEFYFENDLLTNKFNWIKYMGYDLFIRGILKSVEMICQKTTLPLYFYEYSFQTNKTHTFTGGSGHYDEVQYLFYPQHPSWNPNESTSDVITRKRLVKLWSNFANTGNPTPDEDDLLQYIRWPSHCQNQTYLDIGNDLVLKNVPSSEHVNFWKFLFDICGFPPYLTY